jgi:hypothetical protein
MKTQSLGKPSKPLRDSFDFFASDYMKTGNIHESLEALMKSTQGSNSTKEVHEAVKSILQLNEQIKKENVKQ